MPLADRLMYVFMYIATLTLYNLHVCIVGCPMVVIHNIWLSLLAGLDYMLLCK